MKFTNYNLAHQCLVKIEACQKHMEHLDVACHFLHGFNPRLEVTTGTLRSLLVEEELETWRNLFMWAITMDDAERDRIKAAAYERFLSPEISVGRYFSENTAGWLASDEEEFREMCRRLFSPGEEA